MLIYGLRAAYNELLQHCATQLWSAFFCESTRWQRGNLYPMLCSKTDRDTALECPIPLKQDFVQLQDIQPYKLNVLH